MEYDINDILLPAKQMLFLAAHTEGTAERLGQHELSHIVFKRVAEFQLELLQTIEHVLDAALVRPAFSTLRTLLELTTSFAWLADDFNARLERFSNGQCPGVQKMMSRANLGWDDEYKKIYSPLSDFVHGSFALADFNKIEKIYNNKDHVPYSAFGDYFILDDDDTKRIRLVEERQPKDLIAIHGGFIVAKSFDCILTMLLRASGDYSDSFSWWPGQECIKFFDRLVKTYWQDMNFLWLSEKNRLAICRTEGVYA